MAQNNLSGSLYAHVPLPAGAVSVLPWEHSDDGTGWRCVDGTTRTVEIELPHTSFNIEVTIEGTQYADARVDYGAIRVTGVAPDNPMTIEQAREFASAVLEATAEADGWAREMTTPVPDAEANWLLREIRGSNEGSSPTRPERRRTHAVV